jgi:cytochrome c biogenesis protein CcmG/thiol:disulfide interchange protein DsbE
MYEKYKAKGIVVLGVNVQWDKEQLMRTFLEVYKITYPVGRDASGAIGAQYQVEATPTTLFIDKVGRLTEQHEGGLEEAEFVKRIDALLK